MPRELIESRATLVVAPTSLVSQWHEEVYKLTKAGALSVFAFSGSKVKHVSANYCRYLDGDEVDVEDIPRGAEIMAPWDDSNGPISAENRRKYTCKVVGINL